MSKNVDNSNGFQLYELCKEFYKYEQYLLKSERDNNNICYLIDAKSINYLKKQIYYDELKKYFENDISKEKFREIAKRFEIKNKIDLFPETFKTSDNLIESLNNGNKYYYITQSLCSKICKEQIFENCGIKYSNHGNKIEFTFSDNNTLKFLINLSGLIEKSLLIKDTQKRNNNEIKNVLEILIRLFYFNKFLKEKDNLEFKTLKKENFHSVYLINNDWLEKYKSFYDYNELENYLL